MSSDQHGPIRKGSFFLVLPVPEPYTFVFESARRQEPSLQVGDTLPQARGWWASCGTLQKASAFHTSAWHTGDGCQVPGSVHPPGPL